MCLTVPCRVLAVDGVRAQVSRGGETIEVSLELFNGTVAPGDWVAVQAQRYVFSRLSEREAQEILNVYAQLGGMAAQAPADAGPSNLPLPAQFAFGRARAPDEI